MLEEAMFKLVHNPTAPIPSQHCTMRGLQQPSGHLLGGRLHELRFELVKVSLE